ncbi:MAG: YHS domain-containing protein [Gemmataceae bacterium]|nr:YHS domain-containing protein [Gemmata sp.]MDW8198999.1 YHS domain-containing protein [Gemmataceae bacterium]
MRGLLLVMVCAIIEQALFDFGTISECHSASAPPTTAKEAFQPFQGLIGSWKGRGTPEGNKDERAAGAWEEKITWEWKFQDGDAWLHIRFTGSKHFMHGDLRYTPAGDASEARFTLTLSCSDRSTATFAGTYDAQLRVLTLTRTDGPATEEQRLVFSLLHPNRYLYRFDVRPAHTKVAFTKKYQVGATKEGEAFAQVPKGPECIVSGGLGTITVVYKGQTYYVCCSGCRDEFRAHPEKYIREAEAKAQGK